MFDKILKTCLLLSPLMYVSGVPIDTVDLKAFPLFVILLLIGSLTSKPQRILDFKPLVYIISLSAINLFFFAFNPIVMSAFINLSFGILAIYLIATFCEDHKSCYKYLLWAALLNIIVFIGQSNGISPIIVNLDGQPGGILGNGPRFCTYLAIIVPFAYVIRWWSVILFVLVAVVCKEYTLLLSATLTLTLMQRVIDKRFFLVLLGVIPFLWTDITRSFLNRWQLWQPTIDIIFQNKVKGLGLGMFPHVSDQFIKVPCWGKGFYQADALFSSFLQFLFGVGLLGVGVIFHAIKDLKDNFRITPACLSLLMLIVLCCVEYPFEIPKLWITICFVISVFFIEKGGFNAVHQS